MDPVLSVKAGDWGFENNAWVIKDLKLTLSSPYWNYNESSLLRLECRDIRAEWNLAGTTLRPDQLSRLTLKLVRSDPAELLPDRLAFSGDIRGLLTETLSPHFSKSSLDQRFHLSAACPANMQKVLQGILRAWLVNWPQKEPAEFAKFLEAVEEQLLSIPLKDIGALSKVPREILEGADGSSKQLKIFSGATKSLLRMALLDEGATLGVEESLSPKARKLLNEAAPKGNSVELLLPAASMSQIAELASQRIPSKGLVSRSEASALRIDTGSHVNLVDFIGLVPELKEYESRFLKMRPRIVFEDCALNPAIPGIRPFVTAGGSNGLDLDWQASLEFLDPETEKVLAKRHLERFVLSAAFFRSGDIFVPRFLGGRVTPGSPASRCVVLPFPAEFLLTVDWLFQSEGIRKTINEGIFSKVKYDPSLKLNMRQVGEVSLKSAREGGGFFSEAIIFGAEFK